MTARRLLVVAVAVAWLLPGTMAGAIALHVAFEHAGGHDHEATSHRVEVVALAEDGRVHAGRVHAGRFHAGGELPHQHSAVVTAADLAIRRGLGSPTRDPGVASIATWTGRVGVDARAPAARPLSEPPRASGPPLLARLSTLRI